MVWRSRTYALVVKLVLVGKVQLCRVASERSTPGRDSIHTTYVSSEKKTEKKYRVNSSLVQCNRTDQVNAKLAVIGDQRPDPFPLLLPFPLVSFNSIDAVDSHADYK